jgi:four helix bundle protein
LCLAVYASVKKLPAEEKYRLSDQMCRSAYSIPMNIAEGNARRTKKDKSHFFLMALSSLEELHYQFRLASDLLYISQNDHEIIKGQIRKVSYLLTRLRTSISL